MRHFNLSKVEKPESLAEPCSRGPWPSRLLRCVTPAHASSRPTIGLFHQNTMLPVSSPVSIFSTATVINFTRPLLHKTTVAISQGLPNLALTALLVLTRHTIKPRYSASTNAEGMHVHGADTHTASALSKQRKWHRKQKKEEAAGHFPILISLAFPCSQMKTQAQAVSKLPPNLRPHPGTIVRIITIRSSRTGQRRWPQRPEHHRHAGAERHQQ